jgi:hypothetical protein
MKIIQNVDRDGEVDHCYASAAGAASPSPQRQRRASLSTTRELAFSRSVDHFTGTQNKPTSGVGGATSFVDLAGVHSSQCEQIAGNKSQQPEADALSVTTGLSTGNVEESAAKVVRAEITEVSMVPAKETVSLKSEEVVSINKEKCEGQDNHVTGHITFQIKTGAESVSPELQSTRQLRNMENLLNSSCDQDGESNSIRNSAGGLGSAPVGELEINQTEVSSDNGEPTGLCCSGDTGVRKPVSNLGACEQNSASLQTQDGKSPPSDDRAETGSNTNLDYDNMKTECGKKENWATPLQSLDNSATQYSDDTTVQILSTCTNDEDDVSQGCSSGKENQTASEVLDSVDGEIASSTAMTSPSEGKALVVSAAKCESQRHSSALMSGEPAAVNAPSLTPGLVASSDGNICTPMRFATASDTENGNVTAVLKSDGGTISSDAREQIPAIIVSIYEKTVSAERGMPRELQALSAAVDEGTYPRTASTDSSSQHHVTTTTSDHIEDIGRDETEQETDMDVLMQENVDDSQCQSPLEQPIAPAESRPSSELATDAANGVTESASTRCEDGQPTTAGGDSKEVPSALDDGKHQMAADDIAPADDMTCLSQVDTDTVDAASQPRAESATATAASNLLPKQEELDNGIRISDPVQVQAD